MPNHCGRSDQLPGEPDGVFLEVVAERKVPEHLEERMVTIGKADVLEVVMLAARTNALLRRRCTPVVALLQTKEDVLELVHAGVGEEQAWDRSRERATTNGPLYVHSG